MGILAVTRKCVDLRCIYGARDYHDPGTFEDSANLPRSVHLYRAPNVRGIVRQQPPTRTLLMPESTER